MYREFSQCRVCGNEVLEQVLDLGTMSLTGTFPRHREDPVPSGPLELVQIMVDAELASLAPTATVGAKRR